jgi:hypothetical protein
MRWKATKLTNRTYQLFELPELKAKPLNLQARDPFHDFGAAAT